MSGAGSDKRKTPRLQPFVVPCKIVQGGRRWNGYLTDLSTLGARVSCDSDPPASGEAVVLEVRFGRRPLSRLAGVVKWSRPVPGATPASCFGVTFEGLGADELQILDAVVTEFRKRAELLA